MAPKRKRTDILGTVADIERRLPGLKADLIATAALSEEVCRLIFEDLTDIDDDDDDDDHLENGTDRNTKYNQAGVRLWNTAMRLQSHARSTTEKDYQRLLAKCRVLAFFIIDAGLAATLESCAESTSNCVYLYSIAISVANVFTVNVGVDKWSSDETRIMRLVLDKTGRYRDTLSRDPIKREDDNGNDIARRSTKVKHFDQERTILEMAQAWREERFADADELYRTKVAPYDAFQMGASGSSREVQEHLVNLLFMHGKQLLVQADFAGAQTWLTRANRCFSKPSEGDKDVLAVRKSVMHMLAMASVQLATPESLEEARQIAATLAAYPGGEDDHRVLMLQLKLYDSPMEASFQADAYANVLLKLVTSFANTADEFALLYHHIQKLHSKSPGLGCSVLDTFLLALHSGQVIHGQSNGPSNGPQWMAWMEKLVILRVWLLAHQRQTEEELDAAQAVMEKLNITIGAAEAAAAQTIMWKKIEQGYQSKEYAAATRWCRLALSRLFEAGGRANRTLVERKQLLCMVEGGELGGAQEAYARMSEATRDEPMTKYLVYKMAIQLEDLALAGECLRCIAMSPEKTELLNACVLHAQNVKRPLFVAQALKKLADSVNRDRSNDSRAGESSKDSQVHTPALFRCTLLLLRDIVEGKCKGTQYDAIDMQGAVSDLLAVTQGVIDAVEMERDFPVAGRSGLFSTAELEWFCQLAHSLGLKHSETWELRQTITLLKACIKLCDLLASQQATELNEGGKGKEVTETLWSTDTVDCTDKWMVRTRLSSRFLIASGLAALVRSAASAGNIRAADTEQMKDDCHAMREHIRAYSSELAFSHFGRDPNYEGKLAVLLVFDFEGAIRLVEWGDLEGICDRAAECGTTDTLRVLGDTLLRAQKTVPSITFVSVMRCLVQRLVASGQFRRKQLIRYYRCLFHSALYRDNDAAFEVLNTVLEDDQCGGQDKETDEEVQYMATIAFNEGVDWFSGGKAKQAQQWTLAAMRLAEMCGDGGELRRTMEIRSAMLRLDEVDGYNEESEDIHWGEKMGVEEMV